MDVNASEKHADLSLFHDIWPFGRHTIMIIVGMAVFLLGFLLPNWHANTAPAVAVVCHCGHWPQRQSPRHAYVSARPNPKPEKRERSSGYQKH
jgi:hypothetical protein